MNDHFWFLLYLALPCFVANAAPVFASKFQWMTKLDIPLDGGKTFRKKRVFGDHKTVRGLIAGILFSTLATLLQWQLAEKGIIAVPFLSGIQEFTLFGALGGLGALMGDSIESFFKRQRDIPSGRPFIPFDQIDYIIGFLFLTSFLIPWDFKSIGFLLLCGLILNPITNALAYVLKIKNTYW